MKAEVLRPSAAAVSSSEMTDAAAAGAAPLAMAAGAREEQEQEEEEMRRASLDDKDLVCPICMDLIKDAFLTACGHSFCYMCIVTHLHNKSDCPSCAHYLTKNHLFPNFLLNKLLRKTFARQIAKTASPIEHLRMALQQGCEVSIKDLDNLISLLAERERKMEQHEAETNMQILLEFLHCLRKQKLDELNEVQTDLQYIKEDIIAVERHRIELYQAREIYSVNFSYIKQNMLLNDPIATKLWPSPVEKRNNILVSSSRSSHGGTCSGNFPGKRSYVKTQENYQGQQKKDAFSGSEQQHSLTLSGLAVARKKRVHAQFSEIQECYLQKRCHGASQLHRQDDRDIKAVNQEGYHAGLEDFQSVLTTFTQYSHLRVIAELRHGDLFHSANIVSSIEFDCDDEFFATAGVSKRIKVFEFSTVVNEPADVHCPIVDISTRSKLSCLSWNKYSKNIIASSDYEGIVTVWDVNTRQSVMEYEEHEKRAWSVDFSQTESSMLVSGSDDCKVVNEPADVHCPIVDMSTRSKLSFLSWNKYSKNIIASSDYEGIVTVWDVNNRQSVMEYEEHEKRAWSVDFSQTEPSMLVSGSDDCKVKVWCTKQEANALNINMKANICCVKYNPGSSIYVAVGSADHHIHYFDLRNPGAPLHVFMGHRKAVTYVKFLSTNELASASTDSTLRLWDVKENCQMRTFKGHTNEKNFVGLTVNNEYIACGSETNEVFVYHKAISKPAAWHRFSSSDMEDTDDDSGSYFISAVCWKSNSPTLLTANSQGTIKVLALAA